MNDTLYPMRRLTVEEVSQLVQLRETGHSIPEIQSKTGHGFGTVHRYVSRVTVQPAYREMLRMKQGGSRARALEQKRIALGKSKQLIGKLERRDKLLILAALYWGEGTKRELNIINGDPLLLQVFISCLKELGVDKRSLKFSLRLYQDIDEKVARRFWAGIFDVKASDISISEILVGKKGGRFQYGMCRVRVKRGAPYFKLIMAMIESIQVDLRPRTFVRGRHSEKK